jgi:hypothetical protein
MKKKTIAGGASVLAVLAVLATALPAAAIDDRNGYIECNPGRVVRLNSTTVAGTITPFAVGHGIVGGGSASWSTAGFHSWKSSAPGGSWSISTNGTISSHGVACVPA